MELMDTIKQGLQSFIGGTLGASNSELEGILGPDLAGEISDNKLNDKFWVWNGADWYKTFPYQFSIVNTDVADGWDQTDVSPNYIYTLPIPPQSLTIKMVPASQATPTVGGVVEETSENTFWLINLSGTTGTGVGRYDDDLQLREKMAGQFRAKLETTGLLAGVAANLGALANKVGGVVDQLSNLGGGAAGVIGGLSGAITNAYLPSQMYGGSAVPEGTNGFTEMNALHAYLLAYSRLKGFNPKQYSLYFINQKESQKWQVSLQDFTIQRNAQNPYLYRYNIQLKGWNVQKTDNTDGNRADLDRFAPGTGDLASVNMIELSAMAKMATNTGNAIARDWKSASGKQNAAGSKLGLDK